MQKIKTIIFDLGGVIINLYVEKTIAGFSQLSNLSEPEMENAYLSADVFRKYEKGLISDAEFRQALRDQFQLKASDWEIEQAWNAMLGDIPRDRIESIKSLMQHYKCIILSNTNALHEKAFHKILEENYNYKHLKDLFHEVYFSHDLNQRKPDREIYENVLKLAETEPNEALFMDDGQANLDSASSLGIYTLHIPRNGGFMSLLESKLTAI